MIAFRFVKTAEKAFMKFDPQIQEYLIEGLKTLKDPIILKAASKPVLELSPATHRLRIGNYRAIYRMDGNNAILLKIGHRRDVYR